MPAGKTLVRGRGCTYCRKTGYRGRFAILEAMLVDDRVREMMIARRPPDEIKQYCMSHGMRDLRQEGLEHCLAGRTTPEEIERVTSEE